MNLPDVAKQKVCGGQIEMNFIINRPHLLNSSSMRLSQDVGLKRYNLAPKFVQENCYYLNGLVRFDSYQNTATSFHILLQNDICVDMFVFHRMTSFV